MKQTENSCIHRTGQGRAAACAGCTTSRTRFLREIFFHHGPTPNRNYCRLNTHKRMFHVKHLAKERGGFVAERVRPHGARSFLERLLALSFCRCPPHTLSLANFPSVEGDRDATAFSTRADVSTDEHLWRERMPVHQTSVADASHKPSATEAATHSTLSILT